MLSGVYNGCYLMFTVRQHTEVNDAIQLTFAFVFTTISVYEMTTLIFRRTLLILFKVPWKLPQSYRVFLVSDCQFSSALKFLLNTFSGTNFY